MNTFAKTLLSALILGAILLSSLPAAATPPPAIFDFTVNLTQANVWDGVGYVWEYQVTAAPQNNRGLSHWVLELCPRWFEATPPNFIDTSFFPNGLWTTPTKGGATGGDIYEVEYGLDPPTGALGLKYNFDSGNQLDAPGETDFFSFRLTESRTAVEIGWTAKDGNVPDDHGTVLGPECSSCPPPEIPEPTTLLLLGSGLLGGLVARRRR